MFASVTQTGIVMHSGSVSGLMSETGSDSNLLIVSYFESEIQSAIVIY